MAKARKTNWFAIWVSIAVAVVVVVVAGGVVWMNNLNNAPAQAPVAANVDQETGAIVFGTGPNTVDSYVDFMCPYCNQFEQVNGASLQKLVDSGKITLNLHPLPVLDRFSAGTQYSSRSAAALYAVATEDPGSVYAYMTALFAAQPKENSPGHTNEELVQIAKDAGVNMTETLENDILNGTFVAFAQKQTLPSGASGTPTVVVNDSIVQLTYPYDVKQIPSLLK